MTQALKGELTISDLCQDENDEESQSSLSLVNSADELEGEEKTLSESSSTSTFQPLVTRKVIPHCILLPFKLFLQTH